MQYTAETFYLTGSGRAREHKGDPGVIIVSKTSPFCKLVEGK